MTKTAAVYARFSSDRQSDLSIDDQFAEADIFAAENDLKIVKKYKDRAKTGTNDKRPGLQAMLTDAEKGIFDCLIIWSTNRIHRNMMNAFASLSALHEKDIPILSITQPELNADIEDSDETLLLWGVHSWKDMKYSRDLSKNVVRALNGRAKDCLYMGVKVYGYDHNKAKRYVINESEAAVVKDCFQMYLDGLTLRGIASTLNDRGLRTPRGNEFDYNFIERMFKKRAYIGEYWHKGEYMGQGYPPIISEDAFEAVQYKLTRKRRKAVNTNYLLTSKVFCNECEHPMHGMSGKGKRGDVYYYYACRDKSVCCATEKSLPKEELEESVADAVRETFASQEAVADLIQRLLKKQEEQSLQPEIADARKRLEDIAKKQKNLLKMADDFPYEMIQEQAQDLNKQKEGIEGELRRLNAREELLTEKDFQEFFSDLAEGGIPTEEVLNQFVSKVVIYPDQIAVVTRFTDTDYSIKEISGVLGSSCVSDAHESESNPQVKGGSSNSRMAGS